MTISLAITGASGAQYAWRLLEQLLQQGIAVDCCISQAALMVFNVETPHALPGKLAAQQAYVQQAFAHLPGQIRLYGLQDWTSPMASGSSAAKQMVICPCSTGTLSAVATGASNNLIERAADVVLKERGQLILVPRETPLHQVHLQHMLTLTQMGAVVLPAAPGFYHQPKSIDDLVDFVVARILAQLQLPQQLMNPWGYAQGD